MWVVVVCGARFCFGGVELAGAARRALAMLIGEGIMTVFRVSLHSRLPQNGRKSILSKSVQWRLARFPNTVEAILSAFAFDGKFSRLKTRRSSDYSTSYQ